MAHGGRKEAAGPIRDVPVGGSREYIMRAPIVGQFGMLAAPERLGVGARLHEPKGATERADGGAKR
jgi:hypothetical protein